MPRTLKRRSDAISRDAEFPDPVPGPSSRPNNSRRRHSTSSVDNASDAEAHSGVDDNGDTQQDGNTQYNNIQNLTKKLVRLALSCEYARLPLRRTDIALKIFKESNASPRLFKQVFDLAQRQLQQVFGMQMAELPSREKTTLKDRRAQATQGTSKSQAAASSSSTKSWVLVSTLPTEYKTHPLIIQPTLAPSKEIESSYTALYTFILALIYLNNSSLPEAKLERYLKRVNADTYTPFGSLEKLLSRMVKEGYIEKRRDTTSGEEVVEFVAGPRGKIEVGAKGVAGLVRSVYGFGSVDLDGKHVRNVRDDTHETNRGGAGGNDDHDMDDSEDRNGNDTTHAHTDTRPRTKIERDDLEQRLKRSLGETVVQYDARPVSATNGTSATDADAVQIHGESSRIGRPTASRRGRRTRHREDEDEDDDNDDDDENDED